MKKVLLVGGAGYIGSVVCEELLSRGISVHSIDKFIYENNHSVLPFIGKKGFSFTYGDMCDRNFIESVFVGITDVVILAGLVGDPITKKYPLVAHSINDVGVTTIIDACTNKNINSVILVSTCSNYGLIKDNELADENFELKPLSLYAQSKVQAEKYLMAKRGIVDYRATILRFATAFGISPRMRFDLTLNEFTREIYSGRDLLVFDAHTWRPYCHVRDFANLIFRVLNASDRDVAFQVFNAGGDINNSTKQGLVDLILAKIPSGKVIYKDNGTDPRNYRVDFTKVREKLGFEPAHTISDGIAEVLDALENKILSCDDHSSQQLGNYKLNYEI